MGRAGLDVLARGEGAQPTLAPTPPRSGRFNTINEGVGWVVIMLLDANWVVSVSVNIKKRIEQ